jgi:hypothetical protein
VERSKGAGDVDIDVIVSLMKTPGETRAELAKMSDVELTEHGKTLRKLCRRVAGQKIEKIWLIQLNEARAEWKRRHPTNFLDGQEV